MRLSLLYPVNPIFVTQRFGEVANLAYYKANGVSFAGHNGIDFLAKHGDPIYAAHDGVAYYEIDDKQGHGVVIRSTQLFDHVLPIGAVEQVFYKTIYWHMIDGSKEPAFRSPFEPFTGLDGPGLPVKAGDLIGYADTTGLSTGDHLHFGLKPCFPGEPNGTWYNLEQDNGYMGAIDPMPFFSGISAVPRKPDILFTKDLKLGSVDVEVRRLQILLNKTIGTRLSQSGLGSPGNETYNFGKLTQAAVIRYQQMHGISPAVGFVGPITRASLNQ